MSLLFHKTFVDAATGANGFDSVTVSNATLAQSAGAGLNNTSGGLTITRTGSSPSAYGTITNDFTGKTTLRSAWWIDLTNISIGATGVNESFAIYTFRNAAATRNPFILYYRRLLGGYEFRHRCINDGTDKDNQVITDGKPDWIEMNLIRESVDTAADGVSNVWFGGGDFAPTGELVSTITDLDNFTVFECDKHLLGMRAGATSVSGSFLLDEWTLRDDNMPILYGVSADTSGRPYDLDQLTDLTTIRM